MAAVSGTHRMRLKALDAVIESLPRGQYNRKIRLNDGPPISITHSVFDLWVSAETDSTMEALDLDLPCTPMIHITGRNRGS